jgi:hypothetical protein
MLGVAVELRPRHVKVGPAGPGGRTGPRTEEPGPKHLGLGPAMNMS